MQVLDRLPSKDKSLNISSTLDQVLLNKLETHRFSAPVRNPRGKKIPAGQSYTANLSEADSDSDEEAVAESESNSDDVDEVVGEGGDVIRGQDDDLRDPEAGGSGLQSLGGQDDDLDPQARRCPLRLLAATYEGELFMAQVLEDQEDTMEGHTLLSYMTIKGRSSFAWGVKDILPTLNEDILISKVTPVPVNSRGHFGFEKSTYEKAMRLMVVVYLLTHFYPLPPPRYQYYFKIYLNFSLLCRHILFN